MAQSYPGTQAVIRAITLLKMFDDAQPIWSLSELATAVNLNKTTVFRLLSALENEQLLQRTAAGDYKLGHEMIALGGHAMRINNLRSVSHPIIRDLSRLTGETVTLESLHIAQNHPQIERQGHNWHMLVIDETLGRYRIGINQYIGCRLPVFATSTGRVVLAFAPTETVDRYLKQQRPRFTAHTLTGKKEILALLAQVRQQGYCIVKNELEVGLVAIGAPIFDVNGRVHAAISIVGPTIRFNETTLATYAEAIRAHAQAISHGLGFRNGAKDDESNSQFPR